MSDPSKQGGLDASPVATQRRLKDIVLSTLIVGGGSVVTVLCGIARGKVISLIAGPAGIGLQGILQSTMRTTSAISAMGLPTSGVREVARLRGEDNPTELSHTLRALRLATLVLGGLGALVLIAFQRLLGAQVLGDSERGWTLAVVGVGVFAQVLYATYDAFLRGFRRVALLTKASVFANLMATGLGVVLVLLLGNDGIAWAIVAQPVCILGIVAIVGRDLPQHLVPPDRARIRSAFGRVIRMGVVLAMTGFITTGTQLAARVLVARATNLDDVGYFQAAWAVSVLYLGFVLGAMSLDYYPRLAEMGSNRTALSQMVNEQAKVSFLLAGPALLGLLTLSSQVVMLLYSDQFTASVEILRWQLLGDVLKIGSWTLSYLVLAQGRSRVYFMTELSWNVTYVIVLVLLLPTLGVTAAAAAYVVASGVYFAVLCVVTNRLAGFSWNVGNVSLMVVIAALAAAEMGAHLLLPRWWALAAGGAVTVGFGLYCLRRLVHEAGFARLLRRRNKP
jgi:enterobacterial common antigen flippase